MTLSKQHQFNPRAVHMGYELDKVAMAMVFPKAFQFISAKCHSTIAP
jgi:hypothetical protein